MTEQRVQVDGRTHVWRDHGPEDGAPVVLVHGFPDGPETWTAFALRLAEEGYRVIAPALRGYASGTSVPGEKSTAVTAAGDIVTLLDHLEVERAPLIGHDWGASTGYAVASLAPERLTGLVAIGVPHPRSTRLAPSTVWSVRHFFALGLPGAEHRLMRNGGAYLDVLARRWAPTWDDGPRAALVAAAKTRFQDPEIRAGALRFYRDLLGPPDTRGMGRTPVPGLVVAGEHDVATFGENGFRQTPDAFDAACRLEIVDDAGHWPHLEKPDHFARTTIEFLAGLDQP